jgi:hypothetical protein
MAYLCKCGNKEFEPARTPVAESLQPGVTPEKQKVYLRCNRPNCKRPLTEALELKPICPECSGAEFRNIGPTEWGSIKNGKMYPDIRVTVVECTECGTKYGEDQLKEQAEFRAYDSGFVIDAE